jgi:colanic acid biosynthesis glycosyl transferase WcaI
MRILLLAQCYAPENVSAAVLITNLATDLVRRGHEVTVVTGAPSYPHGRVFAGYRNHLYAEERLDGVRVIRTWSVITPSTKTLPRLLHYGTYSLTAFYGGLLGSRPDVILSYSPPLPLGFSAWLLSRIWRAPWVLEIEDLYPDAAVAAGLLTNRALIRFFRGLELFQYRRAARIVLISETFRRNLLAKGVPDSKLRVIPIWADPDEIRPLEKHNAFRRRCGLDGKFVVMYAGNIGLTSCLEDVLRAADHLREQAEIHFVLVGEGVRKQALEAEAKIRALPNVTFLPYQPRENFPEMLAAADLGLVTLNAGASLSSLPSKVFSVMASARPVLAVTPPGSELMQIVAESGCGWSVPPGEPGGLAEVILQIQSRGADLARFGQNGRACLEEKYSRRRCVDAREQMFLALRRKP